MPKIATAPNADEAIDAARSMAKDDRTNEQGLFNFAEAYREAADILAI